jgi:hypothetical protein
MTLRDEAWNAALEQIVRTGQFKLNDLPFKLSERHTVRRCLKEMQAYSWLTRDSEHSSIWRAGPKAEMLMNLSEEKLRLARE